MLINYTTKELDMCARLMRAEALAEGDLGMLMVGNVIVNRAIANASGLNYDEIKHKLELVGELLDCNYMCICWYVC